MTLAEVQKDGATLRDHLEAAQKQLRRKPQLLAELTAVPCPPQLRFLWLAFLELSSTRGSTGFGPAPITYSELEAWSRLTRRHLTAWQVDVIKRLDKLYLNAQAKQTKKAEGSTDE